MNEAAALEMVIRARQELGGIDATISAIKRMKTQFLDMVRSAQNYVGQMVSSITKVQQAIVKLNQTFQTLRSVALRAYTAIVAFTGIPLKFFGDFDRGMANVNTLLDVSAEKFRELSSGVIAISNQIGESATKLTGALYDIVSAGVDAADSLSVLALSGRAAKAGMTETKVAVNAGIATINAYGLEISELNRVYDLQFSTVKKGVLTYEQMSGAIGQLLPAARKLNASLESVYGSLAFLTKMGLNADEASTSLARAFDALLEQRKGFEALGISIFDASGQFRGMQAVVEDLAVALDGLTEEQIASVFEGLNLDIRAQRAIIPMVMNLREYQNVVSEVSNSAGAMDEAYRKAIDNIMFHWDRAKTSVMNALIGIGGTFREEIADMLDNVAIFGQTAQEFVANNKDAIKSIIQYAIKLVGVAGAFIFIGSVITSLLTPLGIVKLGFLAFAAAWYLNAWGIREKTEVAWEAIKTATGFLWDNLKAFWDWIVNTSLEQKLQDIRGVVEAGWNLLINIAGEGWEFIKKYLPDGVAEAIEMVFNAVIKFGGKVYDAVKKGFETGDWSDALDIAKDIWQTGVVIWAGLKLAGMAGAGILSAIGSIFGNAAGILGIAGIPGAIGLLSVGIQVMEAVGGKKKAEEVGANIALGLAAGIGIGVFTGNPAAGVLAFDVVVNLKLGEKIFDSIKNQVEWLKKHPNGLLGDKLDAAYDDVMKKFSNATPNWLKEFSDSIKLWYDSFKDWRDNYQEPYTHRASGGYISGPGTGTSDSIPAMLSNGEFVINAAATSKFRPILEQINRGTYSMYAGGGFATLTPGGGGGSQLTDFATINQITLAASGVEGFQHQILSYLANISQDTTNFGHITQLTASIQQLETLWGEKADILAEQGKQQTEKLESLLDETKKTNPEQSISSLESILNDIGPTLEISFGKLADVLEGNQKILAQAMTDIAESLNNIKDSEGNRIGMGTVIQTLIDDLSGADMKGLFGAFLNADNGAAQADIARQMVEQLSETSKQAITGVLDALINAFMSWIANQEQKAVEQFNNAVEKFEESVEELKRTLAPGGSLGESREKLSQARDAAQKANEAFKLKEAWKDTGIGAGVGAAGGAAIGAIVGSIVPGIGTAIGAAAGGLIGAIGGALAGLFGNSKKRAEEARKDAEERLKKLRDELETAVSEAFNLDTQNFVASINDAMLSAIDSGEDMATAVGASIYGQVKDSLQQVFLWAQNDLIAQVLNPIMESAKTKIVDAIMNGEEIDFANLFDIDKLIEVAKKAEEVGGKLSELTEQYKQALRDAGISEEIIDALFPDLELEEKMRSVAQSLQSAIRSALESGNLQDFSAALGESIYSSARDGLIKAFMESEIYQQMFAKWFEGQDITFTGDLAADFASMQALLEKLKQELKGAGLDFGYGIVPMAGNGAEATGGLYDSGSSYFAPSTIEAGKKMAQILRESIDSFVSAIDTMTTNIASMVRSINDLVQYSYRRVNDAKTNQPDQSDPPPGNRSDLGRPVNIENNYYFSPHLSSDTSPEDEEKLFQMFLEFKKRMEENQA